MAAADIKLSLVNQALTAVGEDSVTELTGDNPCLLAAIQSYDDIVGEELERNQPKFALKIATPTLLTATSDEPLQYRWQPPSEKLEILAVLYKGVVLASDYFDIQDDFVRCYYNADITLKYVYRPTETVWSYQFRRIIVQRLEALFLRVTERHSVADDRDLATEKKGTIFRHTDSAQRGNRRVGDGSLIEARQGLRRRRF